MPSFYVLCICSGISSVEFPQRFKYIDVVLKGAMKATEQETPLLHAYAFMKLPIQTTLCNNNIYLQSPFSTNLYIEMCACSYFYLLFEYLY